LTVSETGAADRPPTSDPELALFNDAYIAVLIALAARSYSERSNGRRMPWMLAFIVVPLVAHRVVREQLPGTTRARLTKWIASQPLLHAEFPARAQALTPYVRRGLRYGLRSGTIEIDDEGGVRSTLSTRRFSALVSIDAQEAGKQANFLGRWFAVIEDVPSIFRQLGVSP
jgi:hypothetical protein